MLLGKSMKRKIKKSITYTLLTYAIKHNRTLARFKTPKACGL